MITLAKLDELEVDTDVKEDYLGQLHKGQPAEIVVDAAPNRRYKGRLREIIPMGDRTRGVVKVKVTVLDPDKRLFPELSATVNFLPMLRRESRRTSHRRKQSLHARGNSGGERRKVCLGPRGRSRAKGCRPD